MISFSLQESAGFDFVFNGLSDFVGFNVGQLKFGRMSNDSVEAELAEETEMVSIEIPAHSDESTSEASRVESLRDDLVPIVFV
ncbi:hypothetical protein CEXT_352771 [Caerostris extrusa]|uniref:Uncharacterized protein n=1 Tax=Caerostris extrusa TaxID=172846 RepID=A0AAV4SXN7_CAEEX|nr:hypothetical protein CEXT_352771 [Caerostris extrusa]